MEFPSRNAQTPAAPPVAQQGAPSGPSNKKSKRDDGKWGRVAFVVMIAAIVVLLIAAIAAANSGGKVASEDKFVDTSKLQAVFLNTGQVYFGNIKTLNSAYFVVTNIYYLQTSGGTGSGTTASTNSSVSLVKLGCELHRPEDQMVINRAQVTFWENLSDSGQVAKAVSTFEKQNPGGQKCSDQSSSASTDTSNSAQPASTSSTTPTPAATTSTTTKKP